MSAQDRQGVKAFDTGLRVLSAFMTTEPLLMLTAIADRAQMHPAKVHRYLVSLCQAGFVAQDQETGRYRLAEASLRLGFAAENAVDVVRLARPILRQLCDKLQQSVMLGVWGPAGATVAVQQLAHTQISITMSVGTVLPLLHSSTGQTFAAWLPRTQTKAQLDAELKRIRSDKEEALPQSMEAAEGLFADVRRRGLARVNGLLNPAVSGMSCPVFDRSSALAAVISAMGPVRSLDVTWSGATATSLHAAGAALTAALGGLRPAPT